jgi:hypothetical protein
MTLTVLPSKANCAMIRQCEELDHDTTWEAALSIDFWLTRTNERSPFWFRPYSVTKPAGRRNPKVTAAIGKGRSV